MEHGSGAQIVHFRQSGHATVTILDSSTLFFELDVADRAAPGKRAIGFNLASFERHGTVEDDYEAAQNYPGTCDPPPAPHLWDDSGCGGQHMPWDVQILVVGHKFTPTVSGFPTNDAKVKCPFFQPPGINAAGPESGDFPRGTFAHVSVAEVRRALSHRHGKLIVHGSQRWQTPANPAGNVVTATTTVSWKATLIRAGG